MIEKLRLLFGGQTYRRVAVGIGHCEKARLAFVSHRDERPFSSSDISEK